jgi:hypothetical protein
MDDNIWKIKPTQLHSLIALSTENVLIIQRKRDLGILWFAKNPNCPDSIRQEILSSDDALAKHWLDITGGWKKDGVYKQKDDGRWYGPSLPE